MVVSGIGWARTSSVPKSTRDIGSLPWPFRTLTDEQRAFVEAVRDFANRECGTREQRDALTDNGRESTTSSCTSGSRSSAGSA